MSFAQACSLAFRDSLHKTHAYLTCPVIHKFTETELFAIIDKYVSEMFRLPSLQGSQGSTYYPLGCPYRCHTGNVQHSMADLFEFFVYHAIECERCGIMAYTIYLNDPNKNQTKEETND